MSGGKLSLNRETIIETTLRLIEEQKGVRDLSLREIARVLGCAHTNLYNYFSDMNALLWGSIQTVVVRMADAVLEEKEGMDSEERLKSFYERFLDFYLLHPGWFRLMWVEEIQGSRPEKYSGPYLEKTDRLTHFLHEIFPEKMSREQAYDLLHQVHCYLNGETHIFIAGRGIYKEEAPFRHYVVRACVRLTHLLAGLDKDTALS